MEKKEKIEKPKWVEEVESLIPSARQTAGTLAANTIQNLGLLYEISALLYEAVLDAVSKEIYDNVNDLADCAVHEIIKDAQSE